MKPISGMRKGWIVGEGCTISTGGSTVVAEVLVGVWVFFCKRRRPQG